jgi:eukaryotic-like serine/threonine-protein kinase
MDNWTVPGYSGVRELGSGATGHVVEAVHNASGQHVAIKYLSSALANDDAFLGRFRDEARLLVELDMPNVVRIFEYVEEPGLGAAIVMELVDGASLHGLIEYRGPTIPESALAVLKGSLLGLAAAHALGVVHRDYKPENVLVDSSGNSKLADFGIAVRAGRRVAAVGTPLYMAPEQWTGGAASPATDIYAATAVFYECLTGKPPYSGGLRQLRREHETAQIPTEAIPPSLRDLVVGGMAKDPAARPADAMAFVFALEQRAVAAYGPDWEERGRQHLAERTAALLLLLLGGGAAGVASGATAVTFLARRRVQMIAGSAAVAVVAATSIGIAVATSSNNHSSGGHSHGHTSAKPSSPTAAVAAAALTHVAPASSTITCGAGRPAFVLSGTITTNAAGTVTYHWALSNGTTTAARTLTFSARGTASVVPDTFTPPADSFTGSAKLVVTSPVGVTSNTAVFTLSCVNPQLSVSLMSSPPSPVSFACGSPRPGFTITGAITASRATTLTYHWARSDGTSPGSQTISIGAGQTGDVTDSWTPPADTFSGSDALDITAPVSQTASIPINLACTGSHVISVTIVQNAPTFTNQGGIGFLTYAVTVNTDGTAPVNFDWSAAFAAGPAGKDTGSMTLSGQTSYQESVAPPSGFYDGNDCGAPNPGQAQGTYVLTVTATGTDNVTVSQTSSFTLDCTGSP